MRARGVSATEGDGTTQTILAMGAAAPTHSTRKPQSIEKPRMRAATQKPQSIEKPKMRAAMLRLLRTRGTERWRSVWWSVVQRGGWSVGEISSYSPFK